jgi:hypothetical protein
LGNLSRGAEILETWFKAGVEAGQDMKLQQRPRNPVLEHMVWHEVDPHSQIKLALKAVGCPITDEIAGPVMWNAWMQRKNGRPHALFHGLL